jgi:hypothetical protein
VYGQTIYWSGLHADACRRARVCCLTHGRCDGICSGIGCISLQTHTKSHGIQPKYLLSQQGTLRRSTSLSVTARQAMNCGNRQTRQHKKGTYYMSSSSVGTHKPAQKLLLLDLARMPTEARQNKKFPQINPTLSSRKAPATNEARETLPGPAASSPNECKSFIAGWPKRLTTPQRGVQSCSHSASL